MQDCCPVPPAGSPTLLCSTQGREHEVGSSALSPLGCQASASGSHRPCPRGLHCLSFPPQENSATPKPAPWSPQYEDALNLGLKMNILYFLNMGSTLALKGGPAWWAQPVQKLIQLCASCSQQFCPAQPQPCEQHPQLPLTCEEGRAPPLPALQPVLLPPPAAAELQGGGSPRHSSRSKSNYTRNLSDSSGKGRDTYPLPRPPWCSPVSRARSSSLWFPSPSLRASALHPAAPNCLCCRLLWFGTCGDRESVSAP